MKEDDCVEYDAVSQTSSMRRSLKAKLENKIEDFTHSANLTARKVQVHQIVLAKYGPGKVFGHCPYSL